MSANREVFESAAYSGKLWSLAELQRFYMASYGVALSMLQRGMGFVAGIQFVNGDPSPEDAAILTKEITESKSAIDELPLSAVLKAQYVRLEKRAIGGADANELMVMLREFYNNLLHEVAGHWFLVIRVERREMFEQRLPPFGERVADRFPEAIQDIAAACRCYALDEWTACVFHCMRVLEHGLGAMGREVELDPDAMKLENWKNVIDQIERAIRSMEALPKSTQKSERLRVLSAAAADFRYFKDAWRNHVSHSRVTYDERETHKVLGHVQTFMEQLAA